MANKREDWVNANLEGFVINGKVHVRTSDMISLLLASANAVRIHNADTAQGFELLAGSLQELERQAAKGMEERETNAT